ncbi:MAG: PAS domain-containing protein, partial [Cyanobacteriota bacterium]|nr:PAS domain-containing protein [Cyanobacteriota bacterium]
DLENIQRSLNQGMVIVDKDLRVTLFSPLAVRVFGLVSQDVGHPLIGIPTTVPIHGLREALLSVVHEGRSRNLEALSEENSYWLQLMPYRDSASQILGAIMMMTDISELVALRRVAEASLQEFEHLTDALDPVVWKRDLLSDKILYINARIQDLTGWKAAEVAALPDLLDSAIVPEDRPAVRAARDAGQAGWTVTYGFTRRDGQRRTMLEVAIPLLDASSDHAVVGTLSDITDQHQQASHLALLRESLQALLARDPDPTALLDGDLRVVLINPAFTRLVPTSTPEGGEAPPLTVIERLVPLASGRGKAEGAMAEVLRAVAQQAGANAANPVRLPVAWAEGQAPASEGPEAFTLEVVPVPADLEAPGLLLRLRGLAADQRQSSNTTPFAD